MFPIRFGLASLGSHSLIFIVAGRPDRHPQYQWGGLLQLLYTHFPHHPPHPPHHLSHVKVTSCQRPGMYHLTPHTTVAMLKQVCHVSLSRLMFFATLVTLIKTYLGIRGKPSVKFHANQISQSKGQGCAKEPTDTHISKTLANCEPFLHFML